MERDCESELSKLNTEQNACIYHFGASVIHGQRSNILRLPSFLRCLDRFGLLNINAGHQPVELPPCKIPDFRFIPGRLLPPRRNYLMSKTASGHLSC